MPPPPQTAGAWPCLRSGLLKDTLYGPALCSDTCPPQDNPMAQATAVLLHGPREADRAITQRKEGTAPAQLGPLEGQHAQWGTEPTAGASTGTGCLGTWCNPSAVLHHPSAGSAPLPDPGAPLLLQEKCSFYRWHSLSVMDQRALIDLNCPTVSTWAPHPSIQQLHLKAGLHL